MFGNMIGKGYIKSAMMEMSMVSEGYYEKRLQTKSRYGAKTPIIDAVYEILYEGKDARAF
jgi:glycerol-3-phosphate dehydrogenase (NAD(P)+)